jgi:hypothetical protein
MSKPVTDRVLTPGLIESAIADLAHYSFNPWERARVDIIIAAVERLRAERDLLRAEVKAWRGREESAFEQYLDELAAARAATDAFDKEATP